MRARRPQTTETAGGVCVGQLIFENRRILNSTFLLKLLAFIEMSEFVEKTQCLDFLVIAPAHLRVVECVDRVEKQFARRDVLGIFFQREQLLALRRSERENKNKEET